METPRCARNVYHRELLIHAVKHGTKVALNSAAGGTSVGGAGRIDKDGQELDGHLDQPLGAVRDIGLESERVAGMKDVGLLAMAVFDHPLEHMDEFGAGVFESREAFRLVL